jgi:hypothetical protein
MRVHGRPLVGHSEKRAAVHSLTNDGGLRTSPWERRRSAVESKGCESEAGRAEIFRKKRYQKSLPISLSKTLPTAPQGSSPNPAEWD